MKKRVEMKEIMAYHLKTICHGLVVLMPACMSPKPKVEGSSLSWIPLCGWPGYYINVQCCGGLSMVLNSATERPLGTICEEKEISSLFEVPISFQYDHLSCQKQCKNWFLPHIIWMYIPHFFRLSSKTTTMTVMALSHMQSLMPLLATFLL